jgi:hypothetical protein
VSYTISYGTPYTVFPYDGAMIGVSPSRDYWGGFYSFIKEDLDSFNYFLKRMFIHLDIPLNDKSFENIQSSFKEFDNIIDDSGIEYFQKTKPYSKLLKGYNGDLMKHIQYLLNPNNNNFRLVKIGNDLGCDDCEVWTDSPSIMIKWEYNNDMSAKIIQDIGY